VHVGQAGLPAIVGIQLGELVGEIFHGDCGKWMQAQFFAVSFE